MLRNLAVAIAGAALAAPAALAQCRPPATSHEARLLAFYEVPALFSMAGAPMLLQRGTLIVGGEAEPVPSPSQVLTHPEYCYQNTTNNTRLAPVFGRPRLTVGLPAGFALEGSYVPPMSVASAHVTLASVAVSQTRQLVVGGSPVALQLRVHGTTGSIRGPITCPAASLQTVDAGQPCYGTAASRDRFDPSSLGAEAAIGTRLHRVALYAGGGANWISPHFQAGFTDASGNTDRTTVDVALVRGVAFGGAALDVRDNLAISSQIYLVPADVATLRFGVAYRIH